MQAPLTPGQRGHVWLLRAGPGLPSTGRAHPPPLQLARLAPYPPPPQTAYLAGLSTTGLSRENAFNESVGAEH